MNLIQKFSKFSLQIKCTLITLIIALIFTVIYILSGQMNKDQSITQLKYNFPEVKETKFQTQKSGAQTILINCADGSSYQVFIPVGSSDFSALENSYCSKK